MGSANESFQALLHEIQGRVRHSLTDELIDDWRAQLAPFDLDEARQHLKTFLRSYDGPSTPKEFGFWIKKKDIAPGRPRELWQMDAELLKWPKCSMLSLRRRDKDQVYFGWIERQEGVEDRIFVWVPCGGRFYRTCYTGNLDQFDVRVMGEAPQEWPFGPDVTDDPKGMVDLLMKDH